MFSRYKYLIIAAAATTLLALGTGYWFLFATGTLIIVNPNPYQVNCAVNYGTSAEKVVTEGWFHLKASEKITLKRSFYRKNPHFRVFCESADPGQVRWIRELPESEPGIVYFINDDPAVIEAQMPEERDKTDFRSEENLSSSTSPRGLSGMVALDFFTAKINESSWTATHILYDEALQGLYSEEGLTAENDSERIDVFIDRGQLLTKSVPLQREFEKKFPNPVKSFPYDLGVLVEDHNGLEVPGVIVENIGFSHTIDGSEMPFQNGDVITEINGILIFSALDLNLILYRHAESQGIEVPVKFKILRNSQTLLIDGSYYFNLEYWGTEKNELSVVGAGATDSICFGYGSTCEAFVRWVFSDKTDETYELRRWKIAQRNARWKQSNPGNYNFGVILGFFTPSGPRLLFQKTLSRGLMRKGIPRVLAASVAAAALEVSEGVVWSVITAPRDRTRAEMVEDIKGWLPYWMGAGIATGVLSKPSRAVKPETNGKKTVPTKPTKSKEKLPTNSSNSPKPKVGKGIDK